MWYRNTNTAGPTSGPMSLHLFNTAWLVCVRGAADSCGLRSLRAGRNQTALPLALMLMMAVKVQNGSLVVFACEPGGRKANYFP